MCPVERYRAEHMLQRLVERSMFNYGTVTQLKFGDFDSKTAIKFTLLKAQRRELIRTSYYSLFGCRIISASTRPSPPCSCTKLFVELLLVVRNNCKVYAFQYLLLLLLYND